MIVTKFYKISFCKNKNLQFILCKFEARDIGCFMSPAS